MIDIALAGGKLLPWALLRVRGERLLPSLLSSAVRTGLVLLDSRVGNHPVHILYLMEGKKKQCPTIRTIGYVRQKNPVSAKSGMKYRKISIKILLGLCLGSRFFP